MAKRTREKITAVKPAWTCPANPRPRSYNKVSAILTLSRSATNMLSGIVYLKSADMPLRNCSLTHSLTRARCGDW